MKRFIRRVVFRLFGYVPFESLLDSARHAYENGYDAGAASADQVVTTLTCVNETLRGELALWQQALGLHAPHALAEFTRAGIKLETPEMLH